MTDKKSSKYKPGFSGNPRGRPKGRPDRRTAWRAELGDALPAILRKLIDAALEGDTAAAALLLSRAAAPLRPERAPVDVPPVCDAGTLSEAAQALVRAAASGTLAPDVASELIAAIAATARLREHEEILARIETLEASR